MHRRGNRCPAGAVAPHDHRLLWQEAAPAEDREPPAAQTQVRPGGTGPCLRGGGVMRCVGRARQGTEAMRVGEEGWVEEGERYRGKNNAETEG